LLGKILEQVRFDFLCHLGDPITRSSFVDAAS
jgi:hypothetical protein